MTTLASNQTSTIGTFGSAGGTVEMGANIGATQVTVVACLQSFTGPDNGWNARLYETPGPTFASVTELGSQIGLFGTDCPHNETIVFSGISVTQPYLWAWFNKNMSGTGLWHVVSVDDNFSGTTCAAGTELKTGANFVYYLTPGLIDVWLGTVGMAWLAPFLTAFWFTSFDASTLCSALPPLMPGTIGANPDKISLQSLYDILRAIAWVNVCQCKSGGTPPPAPIATSPTGVAVLPTTSCSNANVCATLTDIWQDLANTQKVVNQIYQLVGLTRWVAGTAHSGLNGSGSISVPVIRGFSVTFTTVPASYGSEQGNPATRWGIGRISWSDIVGVLGQEWYGETTHQLVPPSTASLGYSFSPGVVATITEYVSI